MAEEECLLLMNWRTVSCPGERRYGSFEQLSAQITRYFRRWSIYVGGENLTNFKQKNPIIDAANPWGGNFDSTMIWGTCARSKKRISEYVSIWQETVIKVIKTEMNNDY